MPSERERPAKATLRIGDWTVHPMADKMSRGEETIRLETRTMRLLLCLADRAGEVVSIDDLLSEVWAGVIVTPDSVYQAVTSLRRLLGDDSRKPTYIATVPRRGYRLIAPVDAQADESVSHADAPAVLVGTSMPPRDGISGMGARPLMRIALIAGAVLLLGALATSYLFLRDRSSAQAVASTEVARSSKSIAVLPFLDLTDAMNEEPFADGMTEELIDKLSKYPGLHVSAPTSSFYYKDKQVPVADIARSLGVIYVLDGSVRKSGSTMRVSARLVRAGDGFVVWSETYDRPLGDKLKVQDEIANEAAKALKPSIE
ncbi:winged helix-turn-helix domain-containing protein [Luteibacter rhizovicinus]|nr:winged helix-turn-helix domain-containing protein [Luteibacter rhizovicinus]